ncbi:MAG TPA: thioredoxin family protein, partial [Bacillota bacterium]|nr:thioredoxin family protein [Bacillota bacterium]
KKLRVIALTEDWCGDAMLNIPILLRLAEKADMPVRMILRDSNLELMDQYLTNGTSRSIPIFIFINEDGKEIATWGPRAGKIQQYTDQARKELPAKETGNYKVAFHEFVQSMSNKFRNDTSFWTIVYESLKDTLQKK